MAASNQAAASPAVVLAAHPLATQQVGASALRFDPASEVKVDTIKGRFLQITAPDSLPRLLYRTSPHDTVWTELLLEAPADFDNQGSATESTIAFSLDNLDQQGQAELLVTISQSDVGGNAGRENWRWVNLLDITHKPQLLLSAATNFESEAYTGYAQLHGTASAPAESEQGSSRRISLRHHELLIGPIKTSGSAGETDYPLQKILPGRYHYQNGKLLWVGK